MQNILVIAYSQSGQLTEILQNFCKPFTDSTIEWVHVYPETPFPFPWNGPAFFNAMPETVLEKPVPIQPLKFERDHYDLIIFGYQPWFLSPSLPASAILQDESFRKLMKDTNIVSILGCRNMWINSQEAVKKQIASAGGKLIGNVPLIDKTSNLISVITILHWMLTGQKTRKWGIFPKPGVSDQDIENVAHFGKLLQEKIQANDVQNFQTELISKGGVNIPISILFIESRAKKLFLIWANLIMKKTANGGNRNFWINFFKYYLLFALFIVSPIVLTIYHIFVRPFSGGHIKRELAYYRGTQLR
ncbi:hypothetical protein [Fluviicola taffensis]|uniref:Dialkylrecorsinol condensing enzyme DarA n=1 Tax=Fluviicola taffensis (strain DSM 16823 / NCIMB 13979 / RW262) TaxID=755732 RepID=F2IEB6_FLUTR|nr:hypothetical protein [Fluviicola taffensis]AEA43440.1 hypothetical protein Fluta_1446 [Fluviicola taffensis DSM 16823]